MPKLIKCDYVRTVRAGLLEESIGEHFLPAYGKAAQPGHVQCGAGDVPRLPWQVHLCFISTAVCTSWLHSSTSPLRSCTSHIVLTQCPWGRP